MFSMPSVGKFRQGGVKNIPTKLAFPDIMREKWAVRRKSHDQGARGMEPPRMEASMTQHTDAEGGKMTLVDCLVCGTAGKVEIGRYAVTHEMAIDAGDRELEGQDYGPVMDICPECGGCGQIETEEA